MRHALSIALTALAALAGCQSVPRPAPGLASLRVQVIAEPKAGSKLAARAPSVYDDPGMSAARETGAYETVDYDSLDDIIVWLEPAAPAPSSPSPAPLHLNAAKPSPGVVPASVGERIIFDNTASRPTPLYSVSEGNEFDLKSVPANGSAEYTVQSPGLIEALTDPAKEPVLRIYAAPSRWVARARSGQSVDFTDVPPGRYTIVAWHSRLPSGSSAITLSANQSAQASMKIGVNALPKVGAR